MLTQALRIAALLLCGLVPGYLVASTLRQPSPHPVSVRYVANAGVLVEMAGARVLIDALVREGIQPYATTSAESGRGSSGRSRRMPTSTRFS